MSAANTALHQTATQLLQVHNLKVPKNFSQAKAFHTLINVMYSSPIRGLTKSLDEHTNFIIVLIASLICGEENWITETISAISLSMETKKERLYIVKLMKRMR